jgi:hypothetical protein
MFRSTLSALKSTVVNAAKNTIKEYSPSSLLKPEGAFSRITQQGIANLSFRSPLLSSIAETMLQNVQLEAAKKSRIDDYVKSDSASGFKESVKANMGGDTSNKKLDAEMSRILSEISKSIEKNGQEETEKSKLFKEYSGDYQKYKSSTGQANQSAGQQDSQNPDSDTAETNILNRIETNTKHTANTLDELINRGSLGGSTGVSGAGAGGASFIDPVTGMPSIRAAVGSIGGSFLSKVFDDDTLSKFAKKTKNFFGVNETEESVTAKTNETVSDINKTDQFVKAKTNETSSDINKTNQSVTAKTNETVSDIDSIAPFEAKPISRPTKADNVNSRISEILAGINLDLTGNDSEDKKEDALVAKNASNDLLGVNKEILEELKTLNKDNNNKTDVPVKSGSGLFDRIQDKLGNRVPRVGDVLKRGRDTLSKGTSKIGSLTKSGATGVMGAAKSGISKTLDVAKGAASYLPKIATAGAGLLTGGLGATVAAGGIALAGGAAIDSAFGAFGYGGKEINSDQDDANWKRASTFDKIKSAPARGLEKVASAMFMGNLSNEAKSERIANETKYLDDKMGVMPAQTIKSDIVPAQTNNVTKINSLTKENEKVSADKSAQTNIIMSQNSSGNNSQPAAAAPNIIVGTSVRNNESTFERVQMQDFWNRVA